MQFYGSLKIHLGALNLENPPKYTHGYIVKRLFANSRFNLYSSFLFVTLELVSLLRNLQFIYIIYSSHLSGVVKQSLCSRLEVAFIGGRTLLARE